MRFRSSTRVKTCVEFHAALTPVYVPNETIDAAKYAANARQRGSCRRSGTQRDARPPIAGSIARPIANADPDSSPKCQIRPLNDCVTYAHCCACGLANL